MARLQRPRAAARRGPLDAAARARQVRGDLPGQPRRVLHGQGRQPPRSGRGGARRARGRRAQRRRTDRRDPRPRHRRCARGCATAGSATCARRSPSTGSASSRRSRRPATSAIELDRAVRAADLPRADAARDRARAALPLHLEPVAEPRGDPARPRPGHRGHGPRQGPEGAAAPLPPARRRHDLRAARGRDREQPRPRCSRAWRCSTTRSSASPATPTTTSPTRPTTCCRPSRRRCAASASARSCGSRSRRR